MPVVAVPRALALAVAIGAALGAAGCGTAARRPPAPVAPAVPHASGPVWQARGPSVLVAVPRIPAWATNPLQGAVAPATVSGKATSLVVARPRLAVALGGTRVVRDRRARPRHGGRLAGPLRRDGRWERGVRLAGGHRPLPVGGRRLHWTLVPGSDAVARGAAIASIAVDAGGPDRGAIWIGTQAASHGVVDPLLTRVPGAPRPGLYRQAPGARTFAAVHVLRPSRPDDAGVNEVAIDRAGLDASSRSTVYAALIGHGVFRGAPEREGDAAFHQVFRTTQLYDDEATRSEFALTTRHLFVYDTPDFGADDDDDATSGGDLYRLDPHAPATTMVASPVKLSSPRTADRGRSAYDLCQRAGCGASLVVTAVPGAPDAILIGGPLSSHDFSDADGIWSYGRALVSCPTAATDAAGQADCRDLSSDAASPPHVLQAGTHAIAFAGSTVIEASDGGVERLDLADPVDHRSACTSGRYHALGAGVGLCRTLLAGVPTAHRAPERRPRDAPPERHRARAAGPVPRLARRGRRARRDRDARRRALDARRRDRRRRGNRRRPSRLAGHVRRVGGRRRELRHARLARVRQAPGLDRRPAAPGRREPVLVGALRPAARRPGRLGHRVRRLRRDLADDGLRRRAQRARCALQRAHGPRRVLGPADHDLRRLRAPRPARSSRATRPPLRAGPDTSSASRSPRARPGPP